MPFGRQTKPTARHRYNVRGRPSLFDDDGLFLPQWLRALFVATKRGTTERGIRFVLTPRELDAIYRRQYGRCDITGRFFSGEKPDGAFTRPNGATIDRRDSSGIYEFANCRIVTVQANFALFDWGDASFFQMCEDAIRHRGRLLGIQGTEQLIRSLEICIKELKSKRDAFPCNSADWNHANITLDEAVTERSALKQLIEQMFLPDKK